MGWELWRIVPWSCNWMLKTWRSPRNTNPLTTPTWEEQSTLKTSIGLANGNNPSLLTEHSSLINCLPLLISSSCCFQKNSSCQVVGWYFYKATDFEQKFRSLRLRKICVITSEEEDVRGIFKKQKVGSRKLFAVLKRMCCRWAKGQFGITYTDTDSRGTGKIIFIRKRKFLHNQNRT
jgi:hypothetical protein